MVIYYGKGKGSMNVGIIGGSISGLYAAIAIKTKYPDYTVYVIEQNDRLLKKIYATGNGHCNLLNADLKAERYSHSKWIESYLKRFPYQRLTDYLTKLGIPLLRKGDLVYPLSYSAGSFCRYLIELANKLGIKAYVNEKVIDYGKGTIKTDKGSHHYDLLIFAFGGQSQSNLGSDGSLFPVLKKHGYDIVPLRPGLAPIKTKQKTKGLKGVRHEALVKAYDNHNQLLFEEAGEVLFKEDGLSGIVIFNLSSHLVRAGGDQFRITLDLFPDHTEDDLFALAYSNPTPGAYLYTLVEYPLGIYVRNQLKNLSDIRGFCKALKNLSFDFDSFYSFVSSQVTIGGVSLSDVTSELASKKENGVYFIGECLDIDGDCGGYNLSWCLISALTVSEAL